MANENIYFLIPGFLGNFNDGLLKDLSDFFEFDKKHVEKCTFKGYGDQEVQLDPLEKMVKIVHRKFSSIRQSNPSKHIIIIAHSQGCALTSKIANSLDKNTSIVFISPVINFSKVIDSRISEDNLKKIDEGKTIKCELAQNKYRIIDKEWVDSYRNFNITKEHLKGIKQRCLIIRPTNDYALQENADMLKRNVVNNIYFEIEGDHILKHPKSSFKKLTETITNWINNT